MLEKFAAFPEIQVIDLDAALGRGENHRSSSSSPRAPRARGRRRAHGRTRAASDGCRAHRVIVGTSAFTKTGVNHALLAESPPRPSPRAHPDRGGFQGRPHRGEGLD
jgi:phosphoribosylformimino-5-aminoimidazole carboxamide ribotide isomerase